MIKQMRNGKTKSKDERTESDVPLKIFNISSPFLFFLASFSNIFVFVFPIEIKMWGVYAGDNERKRECRECFLFFSTSFNFFLNRDNKGGVYVGVMMGKN